MSFASNTSNTNGEHLLTNEGARHFLTQILKEKDPDLLAVAVLFLIKARGARHGGDRTGPFRVEKLFGELGFELRTQ